MTVKVGTASKGNLPTFEPLAHFLRDYKKLTPQQKKAWWRAVRLFVAGLKEGKLDPSLRIKRVKGTPDLWEISFAADGRATFQYGKEVNTGEPHIVWRRLGTHDIFRNP